MTACAAISTATSSTRPATAWSNSAVSARVPRLAISAGGGGGCGRKVKPGGSGGLMARADADACIPFSSLSWSRGVESYDAWVCASASERRAGDRDVCVARAPRPPRPREDAYGTLMAHGQVTGKGLARLVRIVRAESRGLVGCTLRRVAGVLP
eukprot:4661381-Prymnesium_polylepis.2